MVDSQKTKEKMIGKKRTIVEMLPEEMEEDLLDHFIEEAKIVYDKFIQYNILA